MSDPGLQRLFAPLPAASAAGLQTPTDSGSRATRRLASPPSPASFRAEWQPLPHHAAFEGVLNGGIIGTLLDCHANWTAAMRLMHDRDLPGPPGCVTADYAIRLRRPTPVDRPVQLRPGRSRRGRPGRRRPRTVIRWHHHRHMPRHVRRRRSRPPGVRALVEEPHVRQVLPFEAGAEGVSRSGRGRAQPDGRHRHRPPDRRQARGDAARAGTAHRVGGVHARAGGQRGPRHQREEPRPSSTSSRSTRRSTRRPLSLSPRWPSSRRRPSAAPRTTS